MPVHPNIASKSVGLNRATPRMQLGAAAPLLVTAVQLALQLERDRPPLCIEVCSPEEAAACPQHIPGSVRVWRPDYERPISATQPLEGLAPSASEFESFARGLGVSEDTEVVLIDRKYDATRLWWLFLVHGKHAAVLDGGLDAWLREGFPTELGAPAPRPPGNWRARRACGSLVATADDVRALRAAKAPRLWDVRSPAEFSGATVLRGAARGGRIAWASARVDWDAFRREDGTWLEVADIRERASALLGATPSDGATHTFYCQSAVRTTQLIFGLALAGWDVERLRNYDGSWVEWSHVAGDGEIQTETGASGE